MPCCIVFKTSVRRTLSCSALIKEYDAISFWVEEATIDINDSAAWPAMQEDDRLPFRMTTLFIVNGMNWRDLQHALIERLNRRIESFHEKYSTDVACERLDANVGIN
jgi:hypothetical protein